ncbi:hypothetical protein FF38_10420 [Lucilia cuprina]|uniref:Uncharacterized protein n=1 Tax=Lucilia cuprina TaxID=7375 RepID=A0A0L0BSS1_LUCCU|nr:hypothetical protein FF38_10420 [Lucilia cuprina]
MAEGLKTLAHIAVASIVGCYLRSIDIVSSLYNITYGSEVTSEGFRKVKILTGTRNKHYKELPQLTEGSRSLEDLTIAIEKLHHIIVMAINETMTQTNNGHGNSIYQISNSQSNKMSKQNDNAENKVLLLLKKVITIILQMCHYLESFCRSRESHNLVPREPVAHREVFRIMYCPCYWRGYNSNSWKANIG